LIPMFTTQSNSPPPSAEVYDVVPKETIPEYIRSAWRWVAAIVAEDLVSVGFANMKAVEEEAVEEQAVGQDFAVEVEHTVEEAVVPELAVVDEKIAQAILVCVAEHGIVAVTGLADTEAELVPYSVVSAAR
jgi:hypothetical protein